MSELFVKICGITNAEDAQVALDAGADAIGVVLSEATRQVEVAEAKKIRELVAPPKQLIGVFRAVPSAEEVLALAKEIGLETVQLHETSGAVVSEIAQQLSVIVAYPFDDPDLSQAMSTEEIFLVDSAEPGSGQLFDHSTLKSSEAKMIVAGGLDPKNVEELVRTVRPYGVDVSSGVCGADPRRKDADKVASFIHSARAGLHLE